MLDLAPGLDVLEIGCGWGGFALMAARDYGCRVTAITLSRSAVRLRPRARGGRRPRRADRCPPAGLPRRRSAHYDRIASTEMFEAIGERYWPRFFSVLGDRLKAGGVAALQIITIDERRFKPTRTQPDFIQTYIFPGGMLPSLQAFRGEAVRQWVRPERRIHVRSSPTPELSRLGEPGFRRRGTRSRRSGSTSASRGCGSTTSPTARPVSAPDRSTSANSVWCGPERRRTRACRETRALDSGALRGAGFRSRDADHPRLCLPADFLRRDHGPGTDSGRRGAAARPRPRRLDRSSGRHRQRPLAAALGPAQAVDRRRRHPCRASPCSSFSSRRRTSAPATC